MLPFRDAADFEICLVHYYVYYSRKQILTQFFRPSRGSEEARKEKVKASFYGTLGAFFAGFL